MLRPGDVKILPPLQATMAAGEFQPIRVWRIYFSIRGEGSYFVDVPQEGYTAEAGRAAVLAAAQQIEGTFGDL